MGKGGLVKKIGLILIALLLMLLANNGFAAAAGCQVLVNGQTNYQASLGESVQVTLTGSCTDLATVDCGNTFTTQVPCISGAYGLGSCQYNSTGIFTLTSFSTGCAPATVMVSETSGDNQGPLITFAGINPAIASPGQAAILTATADDTSTGNSNIEAIEVVSDQLTSEGFGIQMVPQDGSFNNPVETGTLSGPVPQTFTGPVPNVCPRKDQIGASFIGLPPDSVVVPLWVRGKDVAGNWGSLEKVELIVDCAEEPPSNGDDSVKILGDTLKTKNMLENMLLHSASMRNRFRKALEIQCAEELGNSSDKKAAENEKAGLLELKELVKTGGAPEDDDEDKCGKGKTQICHIPPGNPKNTQELCVSDKAVDTHLAHGDNMGKCEKFSDKVKECAKEKYVEAVQQLIDIKCFGKDVVLGNGDGVGQCLKQDQACGDNAKLDCCEGLTCSGKTSGTCIKPGRLSPLTGFATVGLAPAPELAAKKPDLFGRACQLALEKHLLKKSDLKNGEDDDGNPGTGRVVLGDAGTLGLGLVFVLVLAAVVLRK